MFKEFLAIIAPYKELFGLLAAVIAGVFFVLDYFATKEEVNVLKCQMQNGRTIVESRINTEDLSKRLAFLKAEVEEGKSKLMAMKTSNPAADGWVLSLNIEISKLESELQNEDVVRRQAAERLRPGGTCETLSR